MKCLSKVSGEPLICNMAFRSMLTSKVKAHHRRSKSTDFDYSKLLDLPKRESASNVSYLIQRQSANALWTPPRSKASKGIKIAKKDKKKQKLPKLNDVPLLEMSLELTHPVDAKHLKRCRSISSPTVIEKPLLGVLVVEEADGKGSLSVSDGSEQEEDIKSKQVASQHQDGHSGQLIVKEKRQSFSCGLQRSCSLDLLSNEYEFEHSEAGLRAQDLESLRQSRKMAYQRFISHQDQIKKSTRRGHNKAKSFLDDSSVLLHQRGDIDIPVAPLIAHRVLMIQQSRNVEDLLELIEANINVNAIDDLTGDALIHIIMKKKRKQERLDFLLTLLIHAKVDVNLQNKRGAAALHMAIDDGDEMCAKALVVFGADVNMEGRNCFTPIDLAINNGTIPKMEELLINLRAKSSNQLIKRVDSQVLRHHIHIKIKRKPGAQNVRSATNDRLIDFVNRKNMMRICRELEANINQRLSFSASIGGDDDNLALIMQQREVALFNKTLRKSSLYSTAIELEEGSRVLCLDGGGVKGLIQIEVLMQIEEKMKRKITELFDWIVGTSTGGIIALSLVYGGKSLSELRQLYFRIKDEIFAKGRYGFGWDSDAFEEILQQYLDPKIKLMDVKHPRVLIAAVNKATTNLDLHFFNNCFEDEFCDYPVWKVARYTSAAPMFLKECDNYVDGGVICNNPTDCGLTVIQNFYRKQGMKPPIALVVSVGSGQYPAEKIGKVDAQAFLYFGKQWLQVNKLMKRTQNLLTLLSQALVESEKVAENSKSRCEEQGIPFYRFNPKLKEIIPAGETDNEKLLDMVIETKIQIKEQRLKEMTDLLQMITISSSDISMSACTPLAPPTQDTSSIEKCSPGPITSDQKRFQQVPQFSVTAPDDEDEGDDNRANDHFNDQLNKSMVHPAVATVDDCSMVDSAIDFVESDGQKELGNGELSHKHYQLEVDSQDQQLHQRQPRNSRLETAV